MPDFVRVLFVCTGNICRSPMARIVGQTLADASGLANRPIFDSAGTHAQRGAGIDPRARGVLQAAGYKGIAHRARKVGLEDFERNALILAMDRSNMIFLRDLCPAAQADKLKMFLDFAPGFEGNSLPDPYYGNPSGFQRVLDLCELSVRGLLGFNGFPAPL